MEGVSCPCL